MARRPMREPMTVVDFPDQLRNDIFYCQRALKEHIKIHQVKINLLLKTNSRPCPWSHTTPFS